MTRSCHGLEPLHDMSLVDEEDLAVLCSKLKPFQSKLLRKWVQGLGTEQGAAVFMKDASVAKNHSTSPPLEDKGEEDEDEEVSGGGVTLETFLTLLLCCERC